MPRNGSGIFNRIYNWQQDAANGIRIRADRMDAEMDGMATALSQSIAVDGQTAITQDLPMTTRKHLNVGNADQRNQYGAVGQIQDGAFAWGGTDTGAADAYEISTTPATTALTAGQQFRFIVGAGNTNTGASTLAVNGLTATAITGADGSALPASVINAGDSCSVLYDGTNFVLQSFSFGQGGGQVPDIGVGSQGEHDSPEGVAKLARLDRLFNAGWLGNVRVLRVFSEYDGTTHTTTTTTAFGSAGSETSNITPLSDTSNLLLIADAAVEGSGTVSGQIRAKLHYFDGSAYQEIPNVTDIFSGIALSGTGATAVTARGSITSTAILTPTQRRSDSGNWRVRWQYNVANGSQTGMREGTFTLIEFEDAL